MNKNTLKLRMFVIKLHELALGHGTLKTVPAPAPPHPAIERCTLEVARPVLYCEDIVDGDCQTMPRFELRLIPGDALHGSTQKAVPGPPAVARCTPEAERSGAAHSDRRRTSRRRALAVAVAGIHLADSKYERVTFRKEKDVTAKTNSTWSILRMNG